MNDYVKQSIDLLNEFSDKQSVNKTLTFENFVYAKIDKEIFLTANNYPLATEYKKITPYSDIEKAFEFYSEIQADRYYRFIKGGFTNYNFVKKLLYNENFEKEHICNKVLKRIENKLEKNYTLDDVIEDAKVDNEEIISVLNDCRDILFDKIDQIDRIKKEYYETIENINEKIAKFQQEER